MRQKLYYKILTILADGACHSGAEIGQTLQVTRSAIWKAIKKIKQLGLNVESQHAKGYCLAGGLELLETEKILAQIPPETLSQIDSLSVLPSLDSTNRYLFDQAKLATGKTQIVFAEQQTAGRGRRGRVWISPFAGQVTFSIVKTFSCGASQLNGLSLLLGLAIVRVLTALGVPDLRLKWPNDVYYQQKKLAGVLLEVFTDGLGLCHVVMGMGINFHLPAAQRTQIDQACLDLRQIGATHIGRNQLASALLQQIFADFVVFAEQGLAPFLAQWQDYDLLWQKPIRVSTWQQEYNAVAVGLDEQGGLLIDRDGVQQSLYSGEVSLRLAD